MLTSITTLHCARGTWAFVEINGGAVQPANLLVVLPDPQPHRLQLRYGFRTLPEFRGRAPVFLSPHRGSAAASLAGGRSARARPACRCRRCRHCILTAALSFSSTASLTVRVFECYCAAASVSVLSSLALLTIGSWEM